VAYQHIEDLQQEKNINSTQRGHAVLLILYGTKYKIKITFKMSKQH
jgi:hypothetical protein